jgi:hypothetical protein
VAQVGIAPYITYIEAFRAHRKLLEAYCRKEGDANSVELVCLTR